MNPPDVTRRIFLMRWAVNAVAVLVATQVVPGIECRSWAGLVVAALLLGLLNAFVKPVLLLLSLPLVVVSLGLFLWVINAVLLTFVGWVVTPFEVAGFGSALLGAAVISIVATLLGGMLGVNALTWKVGPAGPGIRGRPVRGGRAGPRTPSGRDEGGGGGPVIDV